MAGSHKDFHSFSQLLLVYQINRLAPCPLPGRVAEERSRDDVAPHSLPVMDEGSLEGSDDAFAKPRFRHHAPFFRTWHNLVSFSTIRFRSASERGRPFDRFPSSSSRRSRVHTGTVGSSIETWLS